MAGALPIVGSVLGSMLLQGTQNREQQGAVDKQFGNAQQMLGQQEQFGKGQLDSLFGNDPIMKLLAPLLHGKGITGPPSAGSAHMGGGTLGYGPGGNLKMGPSPGASIGPHLPVMRGPGGGGGIAAPGGGQQTPGYGQPVNPLPVGSNTNMGGGPQVFQPGSGGMGLNPPVFGANQQPGQQGGFMNRVQDILSRYGDSQFPRGRREL